MSIRVYRQTGRRTAVSGGLGSALIATVLFGALLILWLAFVAIVMAVVATAWLAVKAVDWWLHDVAFTWREWTVLACLSVLAGGLASWVWV